MLYSPKTSTTTVSPGFMVWKAFAVVQRGGVGARADDGGVALGRSYPSPIIFPSSTPATVRSRTSGLIARIPASCGASASRLGGGLSSAGDQAVALSA